MGWRHFSWVRGIHSKPEHNTQHNSSTYNTDTLKSAGCGSFMRTAGEKLAPRASAEKAPPPIRRGRRPSRELVWFWKRKRNTQWNMVIVIRGYCSAGNSHILNVWTVQCFKYWKLILWDAWRWMKQLKALWHTPWGETQACNSCNCCCKFPPSPAGGDKALLPPFAGSAPFPWGSGLQVRDSSPSHQPDSAPAACWCRGLGTDRAAAPGGPRELDTPKHCFYRPERAAGRDDRDETEAAN